MPGQERRVPAPRQRLGPLSEMAGFQPSTNGRFWMSTEDTPDAYLQGAGDEEEEARARATVGLLRSGLLKRFESSAFAFGSTAEKMAREHDVFLDALDRGLVATTAFMQELSGDDDAVFDSLLTTSENLRDASGYDVGRLRAVVRRDRDTLAGLAADAASISPDRDPKLRALGEALVEIAAQAAHEGD